MARTIKSERGTKAKEEKVVTTSTRIAATIQPDRKEKPSKKG